MGDILNKLKIELFIDCEESKFYNRCRELEKEIKRFIKITLDALNVHKNVFNQNKDKLAKWKKEYMISCMGNLGKYLESLIIELDKEEIKEHCRREERINQKIPFLGDMVLVIINSYVGAVETDLHWVTDLTVHDSIKISNGDFNFSELEKYLPSRIVEIECLFLELINTNYVSARYDTIKEAINCFNNRHEKACNLLLMTIIEGLVRSLGGHLNEVQKLGVDTMDKRKYASLDSFLKKISWKKDLKIDCIQYGLITGNYSLNDDSNEEFLLINLTERLCFLCRRFKENRNSILHGEETQYANTLNSFLNFSALKEVLLTIKEYKEVYS